MMLTMSVKYKNKIFISILKEVVHNILSVNSGVTNISNNLNLQLIFLTYFLLITSFI